MNAIKKLKDTGLTTAEIAAGVGCTYHAIRYYERGLRFPDGKRYRAIVDFAASRGVTLEASDFDMPGKDEAA